MYAADITRTLPVNGTLPKAARDLRHCFGSSGSRGARSVGQVDARRKIRKRRLTKSPEITSTPTAKTCTASRLGNISYTELGHYIGLNVHDANDYKVPLGPGVMFTIEPGIYIPEENLGVRIEDDYFVDADVKLISERCVTVEGGGLWRRRWRGNRDENLSQGNLGNPTRPHLGGRGHDFNPVPLAWADEGVRPPRQISIFTKYIRGCTSSREPANWRTSPSKITFPSRRIRKLIGHHSTGARSARS